MNWSFALINNKLAEVFFEKTPGETRFLGHAYIKSPEHTSPHEREMVETDTKKVQLIYRNKKYTNARLSRAKTS